MKLQSGSILQGGRYRIVDSLGRGGFGVTYLAEQVMARRKVCIKEFFPQDYYKRDEDSVSISLLSENFKENMLRFKAKFIKEAQTIAALDHPNIIQIYDVFEENGTAYYVMDYIEGESLSELVKRNGAMSERDAVTYIKQVAAALEHIHEQQIMHLDVKPGNIMVRTKDSRSILIDFGLSKHYDAESGDATSTTPVGVSHGFAPMEQYKQGGVSKFSPETDIYSLGATLYYLVTGKVPPQAADIADDGLPTLPAHLSSSVRTAIERSMAEKRKDRPHTIKEFLALFDSDEPEIEVLVADDERTKITAVTDGEKTKIVAPQPKVEQPKVQIDREPKLKLKTEHPKRRWWLWLLGLLLIGGGAWFIFGDNNTEDEALPETSAPYQVGDLYNENGKQGVVFEVTDNGRHGKIVSLDVTLTSWSDAIDWCGEKGADWYMPANEELNAIYNNKSAINSALAKYGTEIGDGWYWSSTESGDEFCAWHVFMNVGYTDYGLKSSDDYVRAVSAF